MTKQDMAAELHAKGYNCAQSVACVFTDEVNVPKEILFKTTFKDRVGSITCREIKGNNPDHKILCSCDDCIKHGVTLVEEFVIPSGTH